MSCALKNPENGMCANKRPVQGRRARQARNDGQAALTPLAAGHARTIRAPHDPEPQVPAAAQVAARTPQSQPFTEDAPEATFSLAQLQVPDGRGADPTASMQARPAQAAPPSFREIRAGRASGRPVEVRVAAAAAASRPVVAEVVVPVAEVEGGTLLQDATTHAPAAAQAVLPGIDQLVERVRQRTAARLGRAGTFSPA